MHSKLGIFLRLISSDNIFQIYHARNIRLLIIYNNEIGVLWRKGEIDMKKKNLEQKNDSSNWFDFTAAHTHTANQIELCVQETEYLNAKFNLQFFFSFASSFVEWQGLFLLLKSNIRDFFRIFLCMWIILLIKSLLIDTDISYIQFAEKSPRHRKVQTHLWVKMSTTDVINDASWNELIKACISFHSYLWTWHGRAFNVITKQFKVVFPKFSVWVCVRLMNAKFHTLNYIRAMCVCSDSSSII